MTREEEIEQFALERNSDGDFDSNDGYQGLIEGAQWADEHPKNPWRDARKELPVDYKSVLIRYGEDYAHYGIYRYNHERCYWENMSLYHMTPPDYWMPIPEL